MPPRSGGRPPPGPPAPEDPVLSVKGLGPAAAKHLERMGITTVGALLLHVPRRYVDRRVVTPIGELVPGEEAVVCGTVFSTRVRRGRRGRILELGVEDATGRCRGLWFRAPVFLARRFHPGTRVRLAGTPEEQREGPTFVHPEAEGEDEVRATGRVVPVYGTTEGVSPRQVETWVGRALDAALGGVVDRVPPALRRELGLMPLREALLALHRPGRDADLEPLLAGTSEAHRALLFQDLLGMQLALALRRRSIKASPAVEVTASRAQLDEATARLPFTLTGAQRRVIDEIHGDLCSGRPSCRLLQGDVGCGKTVVAMLASLPVLQSGHQVALMVPTEVLADQHLRSAEAIYAPLGYRTVFLGGSLRARARRDAEEHVAAGTAQVVIGTQALFQRGVAFADLGLAVVDEQHRFGVQQRADLAAKGAFPHVLAMSATPIPRSVAMALYGDLDLSVIDELPPRGGVVTEIVGTGQRERVFGEVRAAVARGERAFVVYPLVEQSEKLAQVRDAVGMAEELAEGPLRGLDVGLLHGRMAPEDKDAVVADFRAGRYQVLATTTVVEVGIDVPEATVMVIENADRFGLAQLHQLRGRVGRSTRAGRCYLFCDGRAREGRLAILAHTDDGFAIAEADLRHRGPGDLLGTIQAGHAVQRFPTSPRFTRVLAEAKRAAADLIARDGFDADPAYRDLRDLVRSRWGASFRLGV